MKIFIVRASEQWDRSLYWYIHVARTVGYVYIFITRLMENCIFFLNNNKINKLLSRDVK